MLFLLFGGGLALLSVLASIILFLKLPFWKSVAGISAMSAEQRTKVNHQALSIVLAVLFLILGLLFAAATFLFYTRRIDEVDLYVFSLSATIVFFNLFVFCFRFFDKNTYSRSSRRSALLFQLSFTILFTVLLCMGLPE